MYNTKNENEMRNKRIGSVAKTMSVVQLRVLRIVTTFTRERLEHVLSLVRLCQHVRKCDHFTPGGTGQSLTPKQETDNCLPWERPFHHTCVADVILLVVSPQKQL